MMLMILFRPLSEHVHGQGHTRSNRRSRFEHRRGVDPCASVAAGRYFFQRTRAGVARNREHAHSRP